MEVKVTNENYEELKNGALPLVIDFWATWCGPCKMISPVISQLAEEYDGKIVVGKCDVEEADEIAAEFGIRNIPTIVFMKNGEVVNKGKYLIMSSHQMETIEEFCTDLTILNRSKSVLQGNLAEIKKSYGRINLFIKAEQDLMPFIQAEQIIVNSQVGFTYQCRVTGDEQANRLLKALVAAEIPLVAFELREPSLHEIFVEKVGEANEE